jgi:cobalt-zinc-cadmium resistance protein CzcA
MIFGVLYATLGSVRASLLILANIPFAVVGGMIALALSGEYLSVPASVGFIALLGIAVLNGLVMVSYFRQLREQGLPLARSGRTRGRAAAAPGADDRDDRRLRTGAAAVRHRAGFGNPDVRWPSSSSAG